MSLTGLNHYLPQLLTNEVNIRPLQRHHIHDAETSGMKGEQEHFDKFPASRLATLIIIGDEAFPSLHVKGSCRCIPHLPTKTIS